jgi:hypothetical protein
MVVKKLQKRGKKNRKKMLLVLKKYLPLQCFNKQRLFYSFKKAKKMKKLVFMFVAMAAISFASCGDGNKAPETPAEDTTAVDTAAADTAAADTANAQ